MVIRFDVCLHIGCGIKMEILDERNDVVLYDGTSFFKDRRF